MLKEVIASDFLSGHISLIDPKHIPRNPIQMWKENLSCLLQWNQIIIMSHQKLN
jgi:hypothetical protein